MKPALALVALFVAGAAQASDWTVHPGESIAAAIARARPGDTVLIERARYEENLLIDKPLTLRGIDRPTISGGLHGDTIRIRATDVAIDGIIVADSGADLEAQNAGIYIEPGAHRASVRHCDLPYDLFGLWIQGADDVTVEDNLITGKRDLPSVHRGNGIELYNSQRAKIVGNRIGFTRDGIYVDVSNHALFQGNTIHHARYGTHYMNSNDNVWEGNTVYLNRGGLALMEVRNQTVRDNVAWGNSDHGIMLRTIQDSVIENNIVAGNARGFFVYDAEYNTLRGNLVIGNHVGVHLWAGSTRNQVDGNDFITNAEQVRYGGMRDEAWGGGGGNYWSNYLGWDRDGNGIGDVPYAANDMVDRLNWRYPEMKLLLASPALQTLRAIAQEFPLLRAPSIVDSQPRLTPVHTDWRKWLELVRH